MEEIATCFLVFQLAHTPSLSPFLCSFTLSNALPSTNPTVRSDLLNILPWIPLLLRNPSYLYQGLVTSFEAIIT